MKLPFSNRFIAINAGAAAIILTGAGALVQHVFARPHIEVCSTRYNRQVTMPLARDGQPLEAADVQALANGQDEGVLDNLKITHFPGAAVPFSLGVTIAGGTVEQRTQRGTPGGISLPWIPSVLEQPAAACLSYKIYLPADMDFAEGGTLPGLFAAPLSGQATDQTHVVANLAWTTGGAPKLFVDSKGPGHANAVAFNTYDKQLPRGRWVQVDQELVLNTPGRPDGLVRMWLDGALATEVKSADLREDTTIGINGVMGDVYFGGSGSTGQAKASATILVSPFEVRWR